MVGRVGRCAECRSLARETHARGGVLEVAVDKRAKVGLWVEEMSAEKRHGRTGTRGGAARSRRASETQ